MMILVDDRERQVFPFLEDASHDTHIDYKIQRSTVGDYAIVHDDKVVVAIERKTWEDLAASFRDGRKENVHKLIELREKTNCVLYYLIEGEPCPRSKAAFGGLPVKCLRAHLDHLAIRDNIHTIHTKDLKGTAERIFELAGNYLSVAKHLNKAPDSNPSVLCVKHNKLQGYNEQLLRCIPGVGSIVSTVLAEAGVTVQGIYLDKYEPGDLATLKYASGASIGMAKANKILQFKKLCTSASIVSNRLRVKMIAIVNGVSEATAKAILATCKLDDILSGSVTVETLSNVQKTEKSKVGEKCAVAILTHLTPITYVTEVTADGEPA